MKKVEEFRSRDGKKFVRLYNENFFVLFHSYPSIPSYLALPASICSILTHHPPYLLIFSCSYRSFIASVFPVLAILCRTQSPFEISPSPSSHSLYPSKNSSPFTHPSDSFIFPSILNPNFSEFHPFIHTSPRLFKFHLEMSFFPVAIHRCRCPTL